MPPEKRSCWCRPAPTWYSAGLSYAFSIVLLVYGNLVANLDFFLRANPKRPRALALGAYPAVEFSDMSNSARFQIVIDRKPPSTRKIEPVTNEEARSEAR